MSPEDETRVGDDACASFSERLLKRHELWWGKPFRWHRACGYRDVLHRSRERFAQRCAADADAAWRCCPYWPRTLVNKWNSREFAQKYGCRVPALYWHGRRVAAIPFASLPARYVVRPIRGAAKAGVHVVVDGWELLRNVPAGAGDVRRLLLREHGPVAATLLLIEEFVPLEGSGNRMPVEYKCHSFGGTVAAVQVIERTGAHSGTQRYYTPRWEPFPDAMDRVYPLAPLREVPRHLEPMLSAAMVMGRVIGTYMRIDFFGSDEGAVFNEFSSTPQVRKFTHTRYCDAMFGALWQQQFPDAV